MPPTPPPADPAPPTWGPLTLLEKIEADATGEVWHAREPALARDVTLTLFHDVDDPEAAWQRLMQEAKTIARVRQPNLAEFHAMERHDARIGVWTEWVGGASLAALLAARGTLRVEEAASIGVFLCRGLAALHAAGAVHGDVQAEHVRRGEDGRVVLTGYALGRRLVDPAADAALPVTDAMACRAPELLAGLPPAPASDLYGVGVLLYRLVTGEFPVPAPTVGALAAALNAGPAPRLAERRPDLPAAFSAAVDRARARLAPDRFANAREMEQALAAVLAAAGAPAPAAEAAPRAGAALRGGVLLVAGALGIMVLAFVAVLVMSRSARFVPTFAVEAGFVRAAGEPAEPLADHATVRPGDHLRLRYRGSRLLFVYVLAQEPDGAAWLVFPRFNGLPQNPLPAQRALELPGGAPGVENAWTVTRPGAPRRFLVAVSAAPLADFEALVEGRPPAPGGDRAGRPEALPPPYVGALAVPAAALERLRAAALPSVADSAGVSGGADAGNPEEGPRSAIPDSAVASHAVPLPLYALARPLGGPEPPTQGVWLRQITFENP